MVADVAVNFVIIFLVVSVAVDLGRPFCNIFHTLPLKRLPVVQTSSHFCCVGALPPRVTTNYRACRSNILIIVRAQ